MPTLLTAALALAFLGGGSPATSTPAAVDVFNDACLSQIATRESLTAQAAARGWTPLNLRASDDHDWRLGFRAGEYVVHLDHLPKTNQSPEQLICVVYVGNAPPGWADAISALEIEGRIVGPAEPHDPSTYTMPPGMTLTMWEIEGRGRVHALVEPDGVLELSVNYPSTEE